jgi:hypothetical protein
MAARSISSSAASFTQTPFPGPRKAIPGPGTPGRPVASAVVADPLDRALSSGHDRSRGLARIGWVRLWGALLPPAGHRGGPGLRAGRRRKRSLTRRVEVTDPRPGVPVFDSVADLADSGADAITVGLFYERFAVRCGATVPCPWIRGTRWPRRRCWTRLGGAPPRAVASTCRRWAGERRGPGLAVRRGVGRAGAGAALDALRRGRRLAVGRGAG